MSPEEKKDTEAKKDTGAKKDTEAKAPAKKSAKTPAKKPAASKTAASKGEGAKAPAATADPEKAAKRTKPGDKSPGGETSARKPAPKKPAAAKAESEKAAKPRAKAKPKEKPEPAIPAVRAKASYVRVAPRKARLIADQVRGMPLEDARTLLRFSPRTAARDIAKVIDSAAANAENNHDLIADDLWISDITVDEGPTLRRYRPRALGRATKINKRTSHIQVALTPED
jgi:large subunit ribosomal protein L22